MILDFSQANVGDQPLQFPDWEFSDTPKQPSQIIETVVLGGNSSTSVQIAGTTDSQE